MSAGRRSMVLTAATTAPSAVADTPPPPPPLSASLEQRLDRWRRAISLPMLTMMRVAVRSCSCCGGGGADRKKRWAIARHASGHSTLAAKGALLFSPARNQSCRKFWKHAACFASEAARARTSTGARRLSPALATAQDPPCKTRSLLLHTSAARPPLTLALFCWPVAASLAAQPSR